MTIDEEVAAAMRRFDRNAHGHIIQALELKFLDDVATSINVIGGVTVLALSSAMLGGLISASWVALALAVVSGAITLTGVLQAVWKPGERAQRHGRWAAQYSALENDCRLALAGKVNKTLADLLREESNLTDHVDLVPERLWRRARRRVVTQ